MDLDKAKKAYMLYMEYDSLSGLLNNFSDCRNSNFQIKITATITEGRDVLRDVTDVTIIDQGTPFLHDEMKDFLNQIITTIGKKIETIKQQIEKL